MQDELGSWGITIYVSQLISNTQKIDSTTPVFKVLNSPLQSILFQTSSYIYATLRNTFKNEHLRNSRI